MPRLSPLILAAVLLVSARVGSSESLRLGSEREVSTAALGIAEGAQLEPRVAFNGENYLVVWRDTRSRSNEVRAARMSIDGHVIDPVGFRVSDEADGDFIADVACRSGDCLVAWRGPAGQTSHWRAVARNGAMSGVASLRVIAPGFGGPKITPGDSGYFVLIPAGLPVGLFLGLDGTVEAQADLSALAGLDTSLASVSFDGRSVLIATPRSSGVALFGVGPDRKATLLANVPRVASAPYRALVVPLPGQIVVVWNEPAFGDPSRPGVLTSSPFRAVGVANGIVGAPVLIGDTLALGDITATGNSLGGVSLAWGMAPEAPPAARTLSTAELNGQLQLLAPVRIVDASLDYISRPVLNCAAGQTALVWSNRGGLQREVAGVVQLDLFPLSAKAQRESAAAPLAGGGLVAFWPEGDITTSGRLMSAITDGETPGDPVVLRSTLFAVRYPAAATSGSRTMVAWYEVESRELSVHLLGMVLDAAGRPVTDALPIVSSGLVMPVEERGPAAIVWTGNVFAVASTNGEGRLLIRRFSEDGLPLDSEATPVTSTVRSDPSSGESAPQLAPAMASSGNGALLVWQDGAPRFICAILCPPSPPAAEIAAVRLDANGLVVDMVPRRINSRPFALRPAAAWNGDRYAVAWTEEPLTLLDRTAITIAILEDMTPVPGSDHFVAGPAPFLDNATIGPLGTGFVIGWSDGRRARRYSYPQGEPLDLYAIIIDRDGTVVSPELVVSAGSDSQSGCGYIVSADGLVAVYERVASEPPHTGVRRIFSRTLELSTPRRRGVRR